MIKRLFIFLKEEVGVPVCYRELVWRVRRLDLLRRILGDRVMDSKG